jgi:hypothetical protein
MAHGSKKWIRTFDGRIKRSNDRTKKDKYGGLRWWHEYDYAYNRYGKFYTGKRDYGKNDPNFCPQCKHVQKVIKQEKQARAAEREAWKAEYYRTFADVIRIWEEYDRKRDTYWEDQFGHIHYALVPEPRIPRPPSEYRWLQERGGWNWGWQYDVRSYLCYKHEYWYDVTRQWHNWSDIYGYNKKHTWARRDEYRNYRSEVKNLMQRAKYDEAFYDDIVPKKRGWLD